MLTITAGWGVRRPPPKEPTPSSSSTSSVSVPEEVWQERKKQKAKERKAERKAERKSKSFKAPSASPEAAKNKPIFRTPAAELSDSSTGTILAKRKTFKGKKGKGTKAVDSDEDKPARPVFKTYSSDEDDINARPSEPRMDLSDLSDHKDEDEDEAAADAPVCPWCGEPVDGALLESYKQGRSRLTVREQTRFCQRHKAQKAADLWTARGYPTIDWEGLEERMAGYYDSLKGVVEGIAPSSYRDALAAKIASGADRALKKEGNLNPGYYGPRGFNFMCDKLVVYFGDMLKKHAVHDRVISGRGSAAFIQNVLVAEMGVRLIGEDMGVSLERAREILEESKGIGEMVHEDM